MHHPCELWGHWINDDRIHTHNTHDHEVCFHKDEMRLIHILANISLWHIYLHVLIFYWFNSTETFESITDKFSVILHVRHDLGVEE